MKLIICLLLSTLVSAGCKNENQVEIIPDYDMIYLTASDVDRHPALKEGKEDELILKIEDQIESSSLEKGKIKLDYKLMIDENGSLNKVQIVESPGKTFDDIVLKSVSSWKFEPAVKDGNKIKSQYRWQYSLSKDFAAAQVNKDEYKTEFDEMPLPVGGMAELSKKIVYPEAAKKEGIEGKVILQVYIDEKGDVVKTEVLKGVGSGLDEVAVKAVEQTKFTPAKVKGKVVKAKVTLPIVFKLS